MAELFLPWEIKLYTEYLGVLPSNFVDPINTSLVLLAVQTKTRITVNQARRFLCPQLIDYKPHPDPARGSLFVWQDDTELLNQSDTKIPYTVWSQIAGVAWDENDLETP